MVVVVVVALLSVIVRDGDIVVVGVGSLLVSALELVDLLIGAGQWVRCPLGPIHQYEVSHTSNENPA